ncbi:MAG: acetyltransferase [Pseudomonadales bacterium]
MTISETDRSDLPDIGHDGTNKHATDVIVFGLNQMSSQAWYLFTHDSPYRVVAFTVDAAFCDRTELHGLPVVPFETLSRVFPPEKFCIHLPIGWKGMNELRASKLAESRMLGYKAISYVSTRANLWPDSTWGVNCEIHQGVDFGPFVSIGANNLVFANVGIGHHTAIGDDCYIGGRVSICGGAEVGDRCVIAASSVILDGVKVASGCFIAAGALVTKDTEENSVYFGRPARKRKISPFRLPGVS